MRELIKPKYLEGKDPQSGRELEVWTKLVESGKKCLYKTKLLIGGDNFDEKEILGLNNFIKEASEINPSVFNTGTQEHLYLTGIYSQTFATILSKNGVDIDPKKARALGMVHDLGRMFTHRKGRNEVIEVALMKKIGFSDEFTKDLYPDTLFAPTGMEKMLDKEVANIIKNSVKDITNNPYWTVVLVADLIAKKTNGRLRRWNDVTKQAHFTNKYLEPDELWPSEKRRWNGAKREGHQNAINYQYEHIGSWLEKKMGISIDSVVNEIETSFLIDKM